jgi:transcription elongation factor GreA
MSKKITREGLEKLKKQLFDLAEQELPAIRKAVATARALGDLSENAEYQTAKEREKILEQQAERLTEKIQSVAEFVIDKTIPIVAVTFGCFVTILSLDNDNTKTFQLLGEAEADTAKGILSEESALGTALLDKAVGDFVDVFLPNGSKSFEVLYVGWEPPKKPKKA